MSSLNTLFQLRQFHFEIMKRDAAAKSLRRLMNDFVHSGRKFFGDESLSYGQIVDKLNSFEVQDSILALDDEELPDDLPEMSEE